ncbi:hypothetical protein ACN9MB_13535 [Dyella kyungheensis]|uniref:hypothetical protein n=1 Tax=Dyella kyungheensis TaxID=1242174 RepID=UPI003CE7E982
MMLTREALPSYIGLFLLCVTAAAESAITHSPQSFGAFDHWVPEFASLLIAVAVWISFRRGPSLHRSLPDVYQNLKSGRQQPSTVLPKINFMLGLALMCVVWKHLFLG